MKPTHKNSTVIIQHNVPLFNKNWFKTGGNAAFFCEPNNAQQFQEALIFAEKNTLSLFLLGKGANILISDAGFSGLTVRPQLTAISHSEINNQLVEVTAQAGVDLQDLINYCFDHNIIGLEEFSGIPSTIGGAVYINLHYFEFLLEQFLIRAHVIDAHTRNILHVENDWFHFGYNKSKLHERKHYLIDATFMLKKATDIEIAFARGRSAEITRHRAKRYPTQNTCGSFFRNFHEHEMKNIASEKKVPFVGYYLDQLGIKGILSQGDACISHQHANMIVNRGHATSTDIITIARTMQQLMHKNFGIIPQPECQFIGFEKYPLL